MKYPMLLSKVCVSTQYLEVEAEDAEAAQAKGLELARELESGWKQATSNDAYRVCMIHKSKGNQE